MYKGQILATINATIYQSMVNKANAQLNQTKSSVSKAAYLPYKQSPTRSGKFYLRTQ
ncbi:MAG: hypothetical protein IPI46_14680 [Bacteroidetes bacterium]|nr:hypothetical protein [Bacteroidota bacterium]